MKNILLPVLLVSYCIVKAQTDPSHFVPVDKHLTTKWQKALFDNDRKSFTGDQLSTIGMPCGGIASGQLYVRGDGTLAGWWIANNAYNTGYGVADKLNFSTALGPWKVCYQTFRPPAYIDQGFTIATNNTIPRPLDQSGFNAIEFSGEYPIATIHYQDRDKPLPLNVALQVYSPFIPLNARESATPATILEYTIANTSLKTQTVTLTGRLQNMVGLDLKDQWKINAHNEVIHENGMTAVSMEADLPALHPYNGNMALSLLSANAVAFASTGNTDNEAEKKLGDPLTGTVAEAFTLKPGQSKTFVYIVSWYFPNRPRYIDVEWNQPLPITGEVIGNNYANWFSSAVDVAQYIKINYQRLRAETFAFHDAYYNNTTIPYWLNRRLLMPLSTLATETCQWWASGKFWAYEGVGSCVGTCTHVWNYEQGMAHLFPELDRNIREQTDLSVSFRKDGGIYTRNGGYGVFIDGHAGTILKAYREHCISRDNIFLSRNWNHIKRTVQYLLAQDGNADGLIEGVQPNTYDIEFYGANTYVGSLYLAALKAAERMSRIMGDSAFADSCAVIAENGKINTSKKLFNGQYFIQDVNLQEHPQAQYGNSTSICRRVSCPYRSAILFS